MVNAALGFDTLAVTTLFFGVAVHYFSSHIMPFLFKFRDVEEKLRHFKVLYGVQIPSNRICHGHSDEFETSTKTPEKSFSCKRFVSVYF